MLQMQYIHGKVQWSYIRSRQGYLLLKIIEAYISLYYSACHYYWHPW